MISKSLNRLTVSDPMRLCVRSPMVNVPYDVIISQFLEQTDLTNRRAGNAFVLCLQPYLLQRYDPAIGARCEVFCLVYNTVRPCVSHTAISCRSFQTPTYTTTHPLRSFRSFDSSPSQRRYAGEGDGLKVTPTPLLRRCCPYAAHTFYVQRTS